MNFRKDTIVVDTDNFWYDLLDETIELEKILEEPDLSKVKTAIETLQQFKVEAEEKELINYY